MLSRKEIWHCVFGWEDRYEVSNFGRIRSLESSYKNWKGRILRPLYNKKGYVIAMLSRPGGKPKTYYVHTLVLNSFVGECPLGKEACHNNGIKSDNSLENLRWDTSRNNALDKRNHKTMVTKLTLLDVSEILKNPKKFSLTGWSKKLNVNRTTIHRVITGETWR